MDRKTVLIVDDAESICSSIGFLLNLEGYTAVTACNGAEGVQRALEHQPDVILLDLMMPVLDGWETIRQLKANPRTADIPVLALTALRLTQDQIDRAGFDGYLSKPVPAHLLTEEIERACSRTG